MRNWYLLFTLLMALMLTGCGKTAPTAGGSADSSQREYNIPIEITNNKAPVTFTQNVFVDKNQSETSESSGQTGANLSAEIKTDLDAALSQGGSTTSLVTEGGKAILEGLTSTAKYLNTKISQSAAAKAVEPSATEVSDPPELKDSAMVTEPLRYHGRHNGDRATWYGSKNLSAYPQTFIIEVPGCTKFSINSHDGNRIEHEGYVVKQSGVDGRGMAIVAPQSCQSQEAAISYMVSGDIVASGEASR